MPPETGEPAIMGFFLNQQSPMREALPLSHLASITYFRSPPKSQSASPIPRTIPPTPRKMSSIPAVKIQSDDHCRRCRQSSIPRPTSTLTHSPKKPHFSTPTSTSSSAACQKSIPAFQPRTYSRTQQSSKSSRKTAPPSACDFSRDPLPRSDSLLPYNQRPAQHDLSGVRQQLHIKNYSTQTLASFDAALSSTKNRISTSLPLPAQHRQPKSTTSTALAKSSLTLTPQRKLMKPIDPHLPRSQTMGSLSYSAGDGIKETPSPGKSDSNSVKAASDTDVGILDVLQESRMTEHEVEVYKQVTKETQMNKERLQRIVSRGNRHSERDAQADSNSFPNITKLIPPQADPFPIGTSQRFGKTNATKNKEMDHKLLRRDRGHRRDQRRLSVDGTGSEGLHVDTDFAGRILQTSTSETTPESGLRFGSNLDDEWEVHVKLVKGYSIPTSCSLQ